MVGWKRQSINRTVQRHRRFSASHYSVRQGSSSKWRRQPRKVNHRSGSLPSLIELSTPGSGRVSQFPFPHLLHQVRIIASEHLAPHRPHRHHFASATSYRRRFRPGSGINRLPIGSTTNVAFVGESLRHPSIRIARKVRLYIAPFRKHRRRFHVIRSATLQLLAGLAPGRSSSGHPAPSGQPEPQHQSTGSGACISTATWKGLLVNGVSRPSKLSKNRWYA